MGITDEANERAWGGVVKASGSDLFSNALCEGRFLADQSFPDEQFDNFADTGSRLHEMMELGTPLDEIEDDNERYAVERAIQPQWRSSSRASTMVQGRRGGHILGLRGSS